MNSKSVLMKTLGSAFIVLMWFACGDSVSRELSKTDADAGYLVDFASTNSHCSEKVPGPDLPQTYCKTLDDGEVFSITLKGSTYFQDPETCVVTIVDDGIKESILEMGFEVCEIE